MRYAIFSDIHANLEALEVVMNHMNGISIDHYICLGDIIGYGANPNECCELVLSVNPHCILGNHDKAAIDSDERNFFNSYARESSVWTSKILDKKYKDFFFDMKDEKIVDNLFLMVHGAVTGRNDYIISQYDAKNNVEKLKEKHPLIYLCFFGHSHFKKIWGYLNDEKSSDNTQQLEKKEYYLINPGSVGQPRDKDPRASYIIFDSDQYQVEYYYLEYDIKKAQKKILEAGLPHYLAERLENGT